MIQISIVPLEIIGINESFSYEEVQIEISDQHVKKLRNKKVEFVMVMWRNQGVEGDTLDDEDDIMSHYPISFLQFYSMLRNLVSYCPSSCLSNSHVSSCMHALEKLVDI